MDAARPLPLSAQPAHDLPRERLVALGPHALSDAELVAIQLGSGRIGQTALALAARLLADFGGVQGMARADVHELSRHSGVGPAKACRIVAAFALAVRTSPGSTRVLVRSSADIASLAIPIIGRKRREVVLLVALDGGSRLIRVVQVASGGATKSLVPVREVLTEALRLDAVAIALAHNHPSDSVEPSAEDEAVTDRLRSAAAAVGLRFLDHVIVAGEQWRSITATR